MDADSTNRSCRNADIKRWQSMDFVVGYEIHRSNNPCAECEVCGRLAGKFPKKFIWSGWHDGCKCYVTPILMDEETRNENEKAELKAALTGVPYKPKRAKNEVMHLPKEFIEWVWNNRENWKQGGAPYYVSENYTLITDSYAHYNNPDQSH